MKTVVINIMKQDIDFHKRLELDTGSVLYKKMVQAFGKDLYNYCALNPPIFCKSSGKLLLLARHHSYEVLLRDLGKSKEIRAIVVEPDEVDDILSVQTIENKILLEGASKIGLTPAAESRKKHKDAEMKCPACESGILQGPKSKKAIAAGPHLGLFQITCLRKKDKKNPCKFTDYLSLEEISLFWKRELKTDKWVQKLAEACPKCEKNLFMRIYPDNKRRIYCEGQFSEGACTYSRIPDD